MLQEKAALHAERKTHGVDLDGVRFSRMVDAERAATIERARRATNAETETCVESPEMPVVRDTAEVHDHVSFTNKRVAVLVRVRPLSAAERAARAVDVVTCVPSTSGSPALAAVHEPRTKVDGTRHVESSRFDLDGAFDARASNADVYAAAIEPLVRLCLEGAGRRGVRRGVRRGARAPRRRRRRCERDRLRVRADGQREDAHDDWVYLPSRARRVFRRAREEPARRGFPL